MADVAGLTAGVGSTSSVAPDAEPGTATTARQRHKPADTGAAEATHLPIGAHRQIGTRAHGTRARYLFGPGPGKQPELGCRCTPCVDAKRTYDRDHKRARRRPDVAWVPAYVPAGPVRRHLDELLAAGATLTQIANRVDRSPETLRKLRQGQTRRVTRALREALLAYQPGDPTHHPTTGDAAADLLTTLAHVVEERRAPWRRRAACRHQPIPVDVFFPGRGEDTDLAHQICNTCPVAGPCLDYALTLRIEVGIWGGLAHKPRRTLRRQGGAA